MALRSYASEKDGTRGFKLVCDACGTISIHAVSYGDIKTDADINKELLESWK